MKSLIAILLLGVYLHTANASLPHVGCAGKDDSLTTHLLATIPVIGRKLLAKWKPCGEEANTKVKGTAIDKFENYKDYRSCCVKCKQTLNCIAWSYKQEQRSCKIFADSDNLEQTEATGHTAGILQWRLNLSVNNNPNDGSNDPMPNTTPTPTPTPTPAVPSPPQQPIIPDTGNDSDNHYDGGEGDNSGYDAGKGPKAIPPPSPAGTTIAVPPTGYPQLTPLPPSGGMLQNKVVYGRRLNSYMPCRGNVASNAQACATECQGNGECKAWTFAPDFNCGWVGEPLPMGLCYLMADVTPGNIYDAPVGDTFISGFNSSIECAAADDDE